MGILATENTLTLLLLLCGMLLAQFILWRSTRYILKAILPTLSAEGEEYRKKLSIPIFLLYFLIVSYVGIALSSYWITDLFIPSWLFSMSQALSVALALWLGILAIRWTGYWLAKKKRDNKQWRTNISGFENFSITLLVLFGTMTLLQTLGYDLSGVLAVGGIAGIAIGLAARDMLANFFGGFLLYLDKPFAVGDWVRSPDKQIEGTVEHIGIRQTKVRTFDKRPLYVPNALFTNIVLENPSRMSNRRIYEKFGLRYDDAAILENILHDIEQWLRAQDFIDQNETLMVNFDCFSESALECFIYTFTITTDWVEFHQIKQKVLLEMLNIISKYGAQCAFPTQTLDIPPPALSLAQQEPESGKLSTDEEGAFIARQYGKK